MGRLISRAAGPALPLNLRRIAILVGGYLYEEDDNETSTQQLEETLSKLGFSVRVIHLNHIGVEDEIREFGPDICFVVDPAWNRVDISRKVTVSDIRLNLELLGLRYTGSPLVAATICRDKVVSKTHFRAVGVQTPTHVAIYNPPSAELLYQACNDLTLPVIVKPIYHGSGVGVYFCSSIQDVERQAFAAFTEHGPLLIESYIHGLEVTVAVLGRGANTIAFPPVELDLLSSPIYDHRTKRAVDEVNRYVPARLPDGQLEQLGDISGRIHAHIGCGGVSRIDFRIAGPNIFAIEINASPSLAADDHVFRSAHAMGMTYEVFVRHLLADAVLDRKL